MKEQNPLDNFLKQKLEQQEFLFKESYWENAEQLIEAEQAEEKKRRGIFWWLSRGLSVLLLLIFVTAAANWLWRPETQVSKPEAQATNFEVEEEKNKNEARPYTPLSQASALESKLAHSGLAPSSEPSAHQQNQSQKSATEKPKTRSEKQQLRQEKQYARQQKRASRQAEKRLSQAEKRASQNKKYLSRGEKRTAKIFSISRIDKEPSCELEVIYPSQRASLRELNFRRLTQHSLSIMTGAALTQGLGLNGLAPQSKRVQPVFGLRYSHLLGPHFRLESGLNYAAKGNLNGKLDFEKLTYGFGSEKTKISISAQTLHYVELPLSIAWRPFGRHYLSVGVYGARLLDVSSDHLERNFDEQGTAISQTEDKAGGYRAGFKDWDMGFNFGYGYYFGRGFKADLNVLGGFTDLSKNSVWKQSSINRNLQLRLSFTYDIFHW